MQHRLIVIGCISAILAVILGAFGAHGLEEHLTEKQIQTYKTGIDYHFYHTFGILLAGILYKQTPHRLIKRAGWLFLVGIILFSGSLYLLSTQTITGLTWSFLGPITPIGGTLFIAGWSVLLFSFIKKH